MSDIKYKAISKLLEADYRATNYYVPTSEKLIILRVDEVSEDIRSVMATVGVEANTSARSVTNTNSAVFMTAYNPFSEFVGDDKNIKANARLQKELEDNFPNVLPCYGESIDENYREEGFLAFPITLDKAIGLCVEYKQNAVLFIEPDGVPQLVFHPKVCFES